MGIDEYWLTTEIVYKKVADTVQRGEVIAEIHSIFGELLERIVGPDEHATVIVGLESNPVAKLGNRIVSFCLLCLPLRSIEQFSLVPGPSRGYWGGLSG